MSHSGYDWCWDSFLLHNSHIVAMACTATVGVVTETNAEKAIEELKAYEVRHMQELQTYSLVV